ncbi:hypothetical protein GX586_12125 [bacterium]|nr:hypothetical protein [bacterium]
MATRRVNLSAGRAHPACRRDWSHVVPHAPANARQHVCEVGRDYSFNKIDRKRCDWVKRYALMGDSGFKYLGSPADVPPGTTITPETLADALRQHDPIKKYRPVVAEPCVIKCPYAHVGLDAT